MPSSVSPQRPRRGFQALLCATALVASASVASAASFFTQQSSGEGGTANVCVYMTDSGDEVAGVQMDLSWEPTCMVGATGSGKPKCNVNAETGKTVQSASRSPGSLRAIMLSFDNVDPIPDGELFCCAFKLNNPSGACNVGISNAIASTPQGQRTTANVRNSGSAPRAVGGVAPSAPQVQAPQAPQAQAPQARDSGAPAAAQPEAAGNAPAQAGDAADSAKAAAPAAGDAASGNAPASGSGAPSGGGNQPMAQAPTGQAGAPGNVPAAAEAPAGQPGDQAAAPKAAADSGYAALGEALNAAAIAAKTDAVQTPTPKATGEAATTPTAPAAATAQAAAPAAATAAPAAAATATPAAATPTPSGSSAGWLGGCQLVPR